MYVQPYDSLLNFRFLLNEHLVKNDTIEFTLKINSKIETLPSVREVNVPFRKLRVEINVYSLGNRGKLESSVFRRAGSLITSLNYCVVELYTPLLIHIGKLESSTLYKIEALLTHNKRSLTSQIFFMSTKDKSNAEEEVKVESGVVGLSKAETDIMLEAGGVKGKVLEGRKAKDWKDYIKCGYKHPEAFTDSIRDTRVQRSLVLGKALEIFEELEDSKEIINGGWFMGPMYVRDTNYEEMIRKSYEHT